MEIPDLSNIVDNEDVRRINGEHNGGLNMNEVSKTLFIPLYGKAHVSRKGIILCDKKAEEIWEKEVFPIKGKAKSKWLAYFMAMRARIFDDWVDTQLRQNKNALVLHIGCGLDSRCLRVKEAYTSWIDADFPQVITQRQCYFAETGNYHMTTLDASKPDEIENLPDATEVIVIMEGISMYLTSGELNALLYSLQKKYATVYLLMDVYTEFGAKASKYNNPINEVGVTKVYGVDDTERLLQGTGMKLTAEHPMTPDFLVDELKGFESVFFKMMFAGAMARKIYRLYELETRGNTI